MLGRSYGAPNPSWPPCRADAACEVQLVLDQAVPDGIPRRTHLPVVLQRRDVGHARVHVHRANGVADRLGLIDHLELRLVVVEPSGIDGFGGRNLVRPTLVEHELREREILLVAGHPVHLHEAHLGDLVPGPDRSLARTEGPGEQVSRADRDVEQRSLAGCLKVGNRGLEQMPEIVELVAVVALVHPALLAGPGMRMLRVDRPRGVEVAVRFLRCRDFRDHSVDIAVELRIGLHAEHVRGAFDDLVEIGVVERIARRLHVVRLAAERLSRALEVVDATGQLALLKGRRNGHLPVGLDPRCPEDVGQAHRRERHRLDGVVVTGARRRLLNGPSPRGTR